MKKILFALVLSGSVFAGEGENSLRITVDSDEGHRIDFGVQGGDSYQERRLLSDRTEGLIADGRAKVERKGGQTVIELNDAALSQMLSWGVQNGLRKTGVVVELYTTSEGATPEDGTQYITLARIPILESIGKEGKERDFDVRTVFPGRGVFPDQEFVAMGTVEVVGTGDPLRFHNPDLYKREVVKNFDAAEKDAAALAGGYTKERVTRIVHNLATIASVYSELQLVNGRDLDRWVVDVQLDALQVSAEAEKWFNGKQTAARQRILVNNLAHLRMRLVTW